eukprot:2370642-Amphidinium_carterae.1
MKRPACRRSGRPGRAGPYQTDRLTITFGNNSHSTRGAKGGGWGMTQLQQYRHQLLAQPCCLLMRPLWFSLGLRAHDTKERYPHSKV